MSEPPTALLRSRDHDTALETADRHEEAKMAVGVLQVTPGGTAEMYDAVAAKLDAMAEDRERTAHPRV